MALASKKPRNGRLPDFAKSGRGSKKGSALAPPKAKIVAPPVLFSRSDVWTQVAQLHLPATGHGFSRLVIASFGRFLRL